MSGFTVSYESLHALEQALIGLAIELDDGGQVTDQYGYSSTTDSSGYTTGHPGQLNGADEFLDDFFTAWQNALAIIGKNIEVLAKQLGAGATAYQQTDQAVQQLLFGPHGIANPHPTPVAGSGAPPTLSGLLLGGLSTSS